MNHSKAKLDDSIKFIGADNNKHKIKNNTLIKSNKHEVNLNTK